VGDPERDAVARLVQEIAKVRVAREGLEHVSGAVERMSAIGQANAGEAESAADVSAELREQSALLTGASAELAQG
jgi:methyl-accepting chemotaxis protein